MPGPAGAYNVLKSGIVWLSKLMSGGSKWDARWRGQLQLLLAAGVN